MQSPSNRVFLRKKLLRKGAVHDHHWWRAFLVVAIRERAATEEPRAHCAQVLRADPIKCPSIPALTNGLSIGTELGAFTETERNVLRAARQRQVAGQARALYTGQSDHTIQHLLIKGGWTVRTEAPGDSKNP